MRTQSLVSATALSFGLTLAAAAVSAQTAAEGGAVRRWPTAADGAASVPTGRIAVARSAANVEVARPAERTTGAIDSGRVSSGDRITVDQGPLEQRRSPGGGGGGGGQGGGAVRGGGGQGGGGGARVAVPRGSGGGGGRPYPDGGRAVAQPRGYGYGNRYYGYGNRYYGAYYPRYYYPYYPYYPYTSFYYGAGYFDTYGYWGAGWGPGFGYAGYPYAGYGYAGNAYDTGRVRLEVEPRDAEVFIDGYYTGVVDDFDGKLQGLTLETGGYSVEIRKPGWETLTFDVRVTPGRTTHYKGQLIPQKP